MEIRITGEFGSLRCSLSKMEPNVAFICNKNNVLVGYIYFEKYRLKYVGNSPGMDEGIKIYELLKRENKDE